MAGSLASLPVGSDLRPFTVLRNPHLIVDFFSLFQNCRLQGLQRHIITTACTITDILQSQSAALQDVVQGPRRALQREPEIQMISSFQVCRASSYDCPHWSPFRALHPTPSQLGLNSLSLTPLPDYILKMPEGCTEAATHSNRSTRKGFLSGLWPEKNRCLEHPT